MKQSVAKDVFRERLFLQLLPQVFNQEELTSQQYLLLLGEDPKELDLLDRLAVPRQNVWSAENELEIYQQQSRGAWGASLYYGDVIQYLDFLLHHNQGFGVLNLDIEGSYLINLDPSMTSVLLFAWRVPKLALVTYHSVGRDEDTLYEGVKSLAFLMAFWPKETKEFFYSLCECYEQGEYSYPERMVLRDAFWVRSMFEHLVRSSTVVRKVSGRVGQQLEDISRLLWREVVGQQPRQITFRELRVAVDIALQRLGNIAIDVETLLNRPLVALELLPEHSIYRSQRHWSQRCYTNVIKRLTEDISARVVVLRMLSTFQRLQYIELDGCVHNFYAARKQGADIELIGPDKIGNVLRYRERLLGPLPYNEDLHLAITLQQVIVPPSIQPAIVVETIAREEVNTDMAKRNGPNQLFVRDGVLTQRGIDYVKTMAKDQETRWTTDEIMVALNAEEGYSELRKSVTAHIAIARRKPKGRSGKGAKAAKKNGRNGSKAVSKKK